MWSTQWPTHHGGGSPYQLSLTCLKPNKALDSDKFWTGCSRTWSTSWLSELLAGILRQNTQTPNTYGQLRLPEDGQVSCPNMAILKSTRISGNAARRVKISSISTPWGRKEIYVLLLELWPIFKFHAQIWQVSKLVRISETAAHRAKTTFGTFASGQVHAQIWQFWKFAHISETAGTFINGQNWFSSRESKPMGLLFFSNQSFSNNGQWQSSQRLLIGFLLGSYY